MPCRPTASVEEVSVINMTTMLARVCRRSGAIPGVAWGNRTSSQFGSFRASALRAAGGRCAGDRLRVPAAQEEARPLLARTPAHDPRRGDRRSEVRRRHQTGAALSDLAERFRISVAASSRIVNRTGLYANRGTNAERDEAAYAAPGFERGRKPERGAKARAEIAISPSHQPLRIRFTAFKRPPVAPAVHRHTRARSPL